MTLATAHASISSMPKLPARTRQAAFMYMAEYEFFRSFVPIPAHFPAGMFAVSNVTRLCRNAGAAVIHLCVKLLKGHEICEPEHDI